MTTTDRVKVLLKNKKITKKSLAGELGISRPALDSKIKEKTEWKVLEKLWIESRFLNL